MSFSLHEILARFGFALILGLCVAAYHTAISRGNPPTRFFFSALVALTLIVSLLMIAIDERLPRALGLFAALSVIRFRMPIKNLREMIFIFIAIAIGIGSGSGAFRATGLGVVLILGTLFFIAIFRERIFFGQERQLLELRFHNQESSQQSSQQSVEQYIAKHTKQFSVMELRRTGGDVFITFEVWMVSGQDELKFIEGLQNLLGLQAHLRLVKCYNLDESSLS